MTTFNGEIRLDLAGPFKPLPIGKVEKSQLHLSTMPTPSKITPELVCKAQEAASLAVSLPARLHAVRKSGLLDSAPEDSFDTMTSLAVRLLKVRACFISVVDENRDFYKSQFGLPEELAHGRELSGQTFCHHTLESDSALVIADTHANPIWRAVPTVESMGIRTYVGIPLKVDGQHIGSFCVADVVPRDWQPEELELLTMLAISVARELDLRASAKSANAAAAVARALALSLESSLAVAAHDLRTPLQVMHLSTVLLKRTTEAAHDAVITRMESAVTMMRSMVDGLLSSPLPSLSKLKQSISASVLAADAVEMMRPIAGKFSTTLVLEEIPEAVLNIDYAQMLRVLGNIIGNALKYSPEGSVIRVTASRTASVLSLSVIDSGIGMDEQEASKAFTQGWQGAPGMVRGDGAGLGLGIVRSLVEQNEGVVTLVSEPNVGTEVTIALPCC